MEDHIMFSKLFITCDYCGKVYNNNPDGIKLWKRHVNFGHQGMKLPELKECPLAKRRKNERELRKVSVPTIYKSLIDRVVQSSMCL